MSNTLNTNPQTGPNRPPQGDIAGAATNLNTVMDSFGNDQAVSSASKEPGFASFPAKLFTTDPMDRQLALRKATVGSTGAVPGVGLATVGPEYWAYLERKSQMMQYADFKDWLLTDVVKTDSPEAQAYWRSKFPELFEEKLNILKEQLERSARLQKIAVLGPSDMEDFILLYMIKRGQIQLPTGTPWTKDFIPAVDRSDITRALFNPKRFFPATSGKTPGFLWNQPLLTNGGEATFSPLTQQNTTSNIREWTSVRPSFNI